MHVVCTWNLPCASYISLMQEYLSQWKVKEPSVREFIGSGGSIAIVLSIFAKGCRPRSRHRQQPHRCRAPRAATTSSGSWRCRESCAAFEGKRDPVESEAARYPNFASRVRYVF
jgi:hypothetical protein